jgi:predicted TPR repeat methyltransferase
MTYSCGCVNEIDPASGVLHCVKKCDGHVTWLLTNPDGTKKNYEEMGLLQNGMPQNARLIAELLEPLREMDLGSVLHGPGKMLEIGCGLGSYVPLFLRNGWEYEAVESSSFAAYWTQNTFDVRVDLQTFEQRFVSPPTEHYDLIFAAHVLEHMKDAPTCLKMIHARLFRFGYLILIVPDDSDPTNPGHQYFFTQDTLRSLLTETGFSVQGMVMKKRVEREKFIYCVARK